METWKWALYRGHLLEDVLTGVISWEMSKGVLHQWSALLGAWEDAGWDTQLQAEILLLSTICIPISAGGVRGAYVLLSLN